MRQPSEFFHVLFEQSEKDALANELSQIFARADVGPARMAREFPILMELRYRALQEES